MLVSVCVPSRNAVGHRHNTGRPIERHSVLAARGPEQRCVGAAPPLIVTLPLPSNRSLPAPPVSTILLPEPIRTSLPAVGVTCTPEPPGLTDDTSALLRLTGVKLLPLPDTSVPIAPEAKVR